MSSTSSTTDFCPHCEQFRCVWEFLGRDVIPKAKARIESDYGVPFGQEGGVSNNIKRKIAYRIYTNQVYGVLGVGTVVKLPMCVLIGVRKEWPDPNGQYLAHKNN